MNPAGYATSETVNEKNRRKRRCHVPAESAGKDLVMAELLRRGFEAELARSSYEKHVEWAAEQVSSRKLMSLCLEGGHPCNSVSPSWQAP